MYGKRDAYFGTKKQGFYNSVWIELIGFDKDKEGFGIGEYIKHIGFKPDKISLHLTSVDFVNTHRGMAEEYKLPAYACSYAGHPCNDDRMRQAWTNYELSALVREFHKYGVKVYASFFDLDAEPELEGRKKFTDLHPELLAQCTNKEETEKGILMIKRFENGEFYEDYLLKMLVCVCRDYGFDGVQLADGISSPRNAIWFADFSDDIIQQSGIELPDNVANKAEWINKNRRRQWLDFYRKRWNEFLKKIICGLKAEGIETAVNSAWTRDPFEALYRYGTDYRTFKYADSVIAEDVSISLAILGYEDNHNYELGYERRRFIHYEFIANLMAVKAQLGETPVTPLFAVWDNQEQWNVLHHMPTAMQRSAAVNLAKLYFDGEKWRPVTNGMHFCLGDALSENDWEFIRLAIDNGYIENPQISGAIFIWSDRRMENELDALINYGNIHSAMWLARLSAAGAAIGGIAHIDYLEKLHGDIVVSNPSLMPEEETEKIGRYTGGRVIYIEDIPSRDVSEKTNPVQTGWPRPLEYAEVSEDIIVKTVNEINKFADVKIIKWFEHCGAAEVKTGKNTSRILIDNNEYYYVLPEIRTRRKIKAIKIITKPDGYPLKYSSNTFTVRVPGRGIDIAEITYESGI